MKSQYGERDTVGTTYLEAQKNSVEGLELGDLGQEFVKGLIEDINDAAQTNPFEGRPFYINMVEERDLQMKNAIKRRIFKSIYRPYPEDNTLVFHVEPDTNKICCCWDLPHHSEMFNILSNWTQYDHNYIQRIREWQNNDLTNFGFEKTPDGEHWIPNLNFKDKALDKKKKVSLII